MARRRSDDIGVHRTPNRGSIPTPREIKAHLDSIVVGQELPKRKLSVAVANHYARLANGRGVSDPELADVTVEKSNIGSGLEDGRDFGPLMGRTEILAGSGRGLSAWSRPARHVAEGAEIAERQR